MSIPGKKHIDHKEFKHKRGSRKHVTGKVHVMENLRNPD
jgi:hypothetical protein